MRWMRLPPARRWVADLSWASLRVPRAIIIMRLHWPLALAARNGLAAARPPWTAIVAKAFGLAVRDNPVLRQMYVSLPWPSLLATSVPAGCILVERQYDAAPFLVFARLRDPGGMDLSAIAARLDQAKHGPADAEPSMRRTLAYLRLPWPLRRLVLWLGMATAAGLHRYGGNFAISTLGARGGLIVDSISVLPVFISFGVIADDGGVDVSLAWDHRMMDGADAAAALDAMQAMMEGPLTAELSALACSGRPVDAAATLEESL